MKGKLISIMTLIIILIVLGHNIYLQVQIAEIKKEVSKTHSSANSAENLAYEALQKANEAAEYAKEASENAYYNNCSYCP